MNPRLVGLDGPLQGEVFIVTDPETSIGRDRVNSLRIPDPSVSRHHCLFRKLEDGEVHLVDTNSRNGTFVNGVPITERNLQHGDQIRIGGCSFMFLTQEEEGPRQPSSATVLRDEPTLIRTRTIVQLHHEESVYLKPEKALEAKIPPDRMARNLQTLLKVSTAIRAARGAESLANELLDVIFETVPASEGAILMFDPGLAQPAWSISKRRNAPNGETLSVPGDLVQHSYHDGIAILTNDLQGREGSLLAAPLAGSGRTLGVMYLGSYDPKVTLEADHLQLVTAIGSISGLALENALEFDRLNAENRRLREEIELEHDMVGESPAMKDVYAFVSKVAPTDSTVLITGESGTGKELAARAIHRNSTQVNGPFVAVNCAALTETLLESELFGHEKGAFTGAVAMKKGKFEVAHGGTIFLDEIGEMSPALQVKLLRVLQEREFERVGGTRPVEVDVRVIAATNRDLRKSVREKGFREDLYYRLNVVSVRMPALRERKGDVPLLASYFVSKYGARLGRKLNGIAPEARARLIRYDWPGNVRELENAIERALVLGSSNRIVPEDLPDQILDAPALDAEPESGFHVAVREAKRQIILQAIDQAGGSQTGAAQLLGINPTYLSRLIRNLDLKDAIRKSSGAS